MKEFRFHGRGGQGAVTAAQLLAVAAFNEGRYAQSFPLFGGERRGAPVAAFTRISDEIIEIRSQIYAPDYVIVLDASLLKYGNPFSGLKPDGWAILNSQKRPLEIKRKFNITGKICCVDANKISMDIYGQTAIPIANISILGALCSADGVVNLDSIIEALREFFPPQKIEENAQAARRAFEQTVIA
ncbi:MAG: 2-oxoacid:acceptor oxidoreductase family protein [Candidatus Tectomicrobia bacterium]|uniref:2-oxoacid:acceptor oxidoreductase family protein n=1 Tax=Tectimicrobiota bacterium TaxID=2528274 RepID=A0A933GLI1_UNCTE|nr:2-oxoacid:acceptor oxidoreductase family protein [Candidatus Tectomicrobia bacterium]